MCGLPWNRHGRACLNESGHEGAILTLFAIIWPDEGEDFFCKFARALEMRKLPGALDAFEARAGNGGPIGAAVLPADDASGAAPQKQRGNANPVQPALELRIVHEGRPGVTCRRFPI